jgi:hypothetical protein
VIEIDRLFNAEKKKAPSAPAGQKKESHVAVKTPAKNAPLPTKNGAPDTAVYDAFLPGSLRRRVWDAIAAAKCPRCSGDHLRIACVKPRQAWEDDFEKDDFFTKKFVKTKKSEQQRKQARVQITVGAGRSPSVLWVTCPAGHALRCVVPCQETVEHLGGETVLLHQGFFSLDDPDFTNPFAVALSGVFAVEAGHLPGGFVALLGLPDVRSLAISLDYVMANPGCDWRSACLVASLESVFGTLALGRPIAPPVTGTPPAHSTVPEHAPPSSTATDVRESRDGSRTGSSSSAGGKLASPSFPLPASPPASGGSAKSSSPHRELGSEPFVYGTPVKDVGPDPHHKGKWYAIRRGYEIGVVSS